MRSGRAGDAKSHVAQRVGSRAKGARWPAKPRGGSEAARVNQLCAGFAPKGIGPQGNGSAQLTLPVMSSLVASRFANCIAHRMSDPSAQSSSSVGREDVATVVEQLEIQQLEFQTQCSQALRDEIRSFIYQAQRALRDRSPAHHSEATIDEDEA